MVDLPPFPVDDTTLDLLEESMDTTSHGKTEDARSGMWLFLEFMSTLGGSDTSADDDQGTPLVRGPLYTEHSVIRALIAEVRRLRAATDG